MNFNKFLQVSNNYRPKSKAFTLIEMLVTISMITVLTTMVIGYSHMGQSVNNLRRAAEQLVSNLRRAESSSMLSLGSGQAYELGQTYEWWGIKIDSPTQYSLVYKISTGTETDIKTQLTISLRKGIIIDDDIIGRTFIFIPPEPTAAYIDFDSDVEHAIQEDSEAQSIILKLSARNFPQYKVFISSTGMIYKNLINE